MSFGVVLLLLDIAVLSGIGIYPLYRRGREDHGDGFATVKIRAPRKTKPWRVLIFYGLVISVAVASVIFRLDIASWYGDGVSGLVEIVTGKPNLDRELHESVLALVPVLAAIDIALFAIMLRGSIIRRLLVVLNGGLVIALAFSVDAVLLLVWHDTGAAIGPRTLIGVLLHIAIATLVMTRVIMSTFDLPMPTRVPRLRPKWSLDGFLALTTVIGAVGFMVAAEALFRTHTSRSWVLLGSFAAYPLLWIVLYLLAFLFGSRGRLPPIGTKKIPIDFIIPAYNETAGIHLTLRSIDAAAARYGGPVRVILADDGSTDGTGDLARAEMAAFRAASGIVVPGQHLGKAAALNTALSFAESDVIVRVDADVVIDADSLLPIPAWFSDPTIGAVGSMMYPRQDASDWCHNMRLFECLLTFGFTRRAQGQLDAIQCIPGTFTAFLRRPALEMGGFVMGVNGEDADLTLQLGRLGYRIIIDPRIVAFEDVPRNLSELREQRMRWNRAGTHMAARHNPFSNGFVGPRLWLTIVRQLTMRVTAVSRPSELTFLVALAIVEPGSRQLIITLVGCYLVAASPCFIVMTTLAIQHKYARRVPMLLTWWFFSLLRRMYIVDALFSLPVKPVRFPLLAPARGPAQEAPALS
jgi:cellulose synthase/poly-beta-1,6-N-acetylglucosamine synthase-like glycosyltransferase